jgi:hypothetical protein
MFSQLLEKKESGEFVSGGADEASLPVEEPADTAADRAEEE